MKNHTKIKVMKTPSFLIIVSFITILFSACNNSQEFQNPERVIQTTNGFQLKEKHLYAYLDKNAGSFGISSILDDPKAMEELKAQLLQDFASMPETFILELNDHYERLNSFNTAGIETGPSIQTQNQSKQNTQNNAVLTSNNSDLAQWQKFLKGSVLVFHTSQHYEGMYVQSTQYIHLCPSGTLQIYESSAGGGSAGGMSINSSDQLRLSTVGNWDVVTQGGQVFFRMTHNGEIVGTIIKIVNNQVYLQGVGALKYFPGAAKCS